MKHQGDGIADEGTEGLESGNAIVIPKKLTLGANTVVDVQVVPRALGVRCAGYFHHAVFLTGQNDERGLAVGAVVGIGAAVVIDNGAAGAESVGAGGGHVIDADADGDGAKPCADLIATIGTNIGLVETGGEPGDFVRGGGGKSNVVLNSVGGETRGTPNDVPCGGLFVGPRDGSSVATDNSLKAGRTQAGGRCAIKELHLGEEVALRVVAVGGAGVGDSKEVPSVVAGSDVLEVDQQVAAIVDVGSFEQ